MPYFWRIIGHDSGILDNEAVDLQYVLLSLKTKAEG
jgi:hypothetical protein